MTVLFTCQVSESYQHSQNVR